MSLMHTIAPKTGAFQSIAMPSAGAAREMASALFQPVARLLAHMRSRSIIVRMEEMGPAELKDIGLSYGDLTYARSLPFGTDPTAALAGMVAERRSRERPGGPSEFRRIRRRRGGR